MENAPTESFTVKSGERQGCIFQVAINWLMLEATSDGLLGFQWTLFSHLEDHDFVDDLAVISAALSHLQKRCDKLRNFSRSVYQPLKDLG